MPGRRDVAAVGGILSLPAKRMSASAPEKLRRQDKVIRVQAQNIHVYQSQRIAIPEVQERISTDLGSARDCRVGGSGIKTRQVYPVDASRACHEILNRVCTKAMGEDEQVIAQ